MMRTDGEQDYDITKLLKKKKRETYNQKIYELFKETRMLHHMLCVEQQADIGIQ